MFFEHEKSRRASAIGGLLGLVGMLFFATAVSAQEPAMPDTLTQEEIVSRWRSGDFHALPQELRQETDADSPPEHVAILGRMLVFTGEYDAAEELLRPM
ncbi:MAG: hypothetical protein KC561_18485, partial [Myxococcales bacterium]|nr:hypothetical protein [Myxococcales bacterium]